MKRKFKPGDRFVWGHLLWVVTYEVPNGAVVAQSGHLSQYLSARTVADVLAVVPDDEAVHPSGTKLVIRDRIPVTVKYPLERGGAWCVDDYTSFVVYPNESVRVIEQKKHDEEEETC